MNGDARGLTGLAPRERNGQYGFYLNFEQQVSGTAGARGASVFLNFAGRPRHRGAGSQLALGLQYKGPFGQARDVVGVAIGATHNNGRYARYARQQDQRLDTRTTVGDGYEYVAEASTAGRRCRRSTCGPTCSTSDIRAARPTTTTPSSSD